MRLEDLVEVSRSVAETAGRLEKIERLASLLARLEPGEVEIATAYLCGDLPQGRIGLGPAAVRDAFPQGAAAEARLTVMEVDSAFARMAAVSGKGSSAERARLLRELLAAATRPEQEFLARLLRVTTAAWASGPTWLAAAPKASEVCNGCRPCTRRPHCRQQPMWTLSCRRRGPLGRSVWYWGATSVSVTLPPQWGQTSGRTASKTSWICSDAGGGRWAWVPCCAPALRPGRLGLGFGGPLRKGAAWRLPARRASANSARRRVTSAVNASIWRCCCWTRASSSS